MKIETLRDLLHWSQDLHRYLGQCLDHCADKNTSERARLVLAYLADHEKLLLQVIEGFEGLSASQALNTWCIEYLDKRPIDPHRHCRAPFAELDSEQIVQQVVGMHGEIIDLYRHLAARVDTTAAQNLVGTLLSIEEHELKRLVQTTNRFNDM